MTVKAIIDNRELFVRWTNISILLVAFLLPFKLFVPTCSFLVVVFWLLSGGISKLLHDLKKRNFVFLFIGFFLLHLISLVYTTDFQSGITNLEIKLTLFFFPLVFSSHTLNTEMIKKVIYSFLLGCTTCCFIFISRACISYSGDHDATAFFYEKFCWFMHPSYFAMYLSLCILFLFSHFYYVAKKLKQRIIDLLIILFFVSMEILCSSKMGLASMFLSIFLFAMYVLISKRKYILTVIFVFGIAITIYLIVKIVPQSFDRFYSIIEIKELNQIDKSTTESTAVRRLVWNASKEIIAENALIGVAPGDVNNELNNKYAELGYSGALGMKLNAHNEFFQTAVGLGLVGLFVLLLQFILPVIYKLRDGNVLYVLFLILLAINFMAESMLQQQAGNIFYAFFNSVLFFNPNFVQVFKESLNE